MNAMKYSRIVTLSETNGAGRDPRFFADGVRISRDAYRIMKDTACRLDCFHSTAKQVGTTFRRTNYVSAYFP